MMQSICTRECVLSQVIPKNGRVLRDVRYHILLKSDKDTSGNRTRRWVTLTTDVLVMPSNLLGVNQV